MAAEEDIKDADKSDTTFSAGSLKAALRAAGSVIAAIDAVLEGSHRNAFCCVRPPGHHAGTLVAALPPPLPCVLKLASVKTSRLYDEAMTLPLSCKPSSCAD